MHPGSPNADEVDDGHTFPVNQTSYSVQLDQVLTTLQGDVRTDLQTFLDQLGNALIKYGGAEGFRELYRTSPPAVQVHLARSTRRCSAPSRGDLSRPRSAASTASSAALGSNERTLQSLVTNFRIFSGSFAAAGPGTRRGDRRSCPTCSTRPSRRSRT